MVSFRMFAGTDVGLRENNEDNFTLSPDLAAGSWTVPADHQQVIPLGEAGCLMVVADGMGGQNAGEVASAIAVETVHAMFSPEALAGVALSRASAVKDYLQKVVQTADSSVKDYSRTHPEAEGLGSTIVMAWVLGQSLFVAWLGDSRAYAFVPHMGIARLSKDHSYVQQFVDAGTLTDIEAMNHPQSNIITRSLGDMSQKAKPDVVQYELTDGEIVLLCSDGLCGVCTDEEIAELLEANAHDLQACKEQLTQRALDNGGSDNITIALLQLTLTADAESHNSKTADEEPKRKLRTLPYIIVGVVALILCSVIAFALCGGEEGNVKAPSGKKPVATDSAQHNPKQGEKVPSQQPKVNSSNLSHSLDSETKQAIVSEIGNKGVGNNNGHSNNPIGGSDTSRTSPDVGPTENSSPSPGTARPNAQPNDKNGINTHP